VTKRWWITAVVAAAAVLVLWFTPVNVKLDTVDKTNATVTCAPFAFGPSTVDLRQHFMAVGDWVEEGAAPDEADYIRASMNMLDRCNVARQNREVTLLLTALAGATTLVVMRLNDLYSPRREPEDPHPETRRS